jgi:hypothetical protein
MTGESSKSISSTFIRIGRVAFLLKILATMGQLCTERSLESKNWSNLRVNLKFIG